MYFHPYFQDNCSSFTIRIFLLLLQDQSIFFSDIMSLSRNRKQGFNFHPLWDIAQTVWQLISYFFRSPLIQKPTLSIIKSNCFLVEKARINVSIHHYFSIKTPENNAKPYQPYLK